MQKKKNSPTDTLEDVTTSKSFAADGLEKEEEENEGGEEKKKTFLDSFHGRNLALDKPLFRPALHSAVALFAF